ncbi:MAG: RNA polymerase sigma factor [Nannocystis sp.]|nr:RNA polymerase sigma factor [Nannocystis sp.]
MGETTSDKELHERYVGGDRSAGATIVARYLEPLRNYIKRRLPAEAEDLAQEALIVYIERPQRCTQGRLRPFLFGVVHNLLLKKYRWKGRHPEEELPPLSLLEAANPGLSSVVGGHEQLRRLLAALHGLPAEHSAVIELLLWGLTIDEVAAALDQNLNTCKGWKQKGIKRLRASLGELRISEHEAIAALHELGLADQPHVRAFFERLAAEEDPEEDPEDP